LSAARRGVRQRRDRVAVTRGGQGGLAHVASSSSSEQDAGYPVGSRMRSPSGQGSGRGEPPGARPRPRARRPWHRRPSVMMDLQDSPISILPSRIHVFRW
jgi:hypothetical protein